MKCKMTRNFPFHNLVLRNVKIDPAVDLNKGFPTGILVG